MLNPPRKLTTSDKIKRQLVSRQELIVFVCGIVLGFIGAKL